MLVAAVAENGVIGRGGGLPWRLKSDLKHFRNLTMGKPVIMGRRTYASIGEPLSGRTNIVVSRNPDFAAAGVVATKTVTLALEVARGDALRRGADAVLVIGGAELYTATIAQADRLVITRVELRPEGDTMFPPIDPVLWREVERSERVQGPDDAAAFTVLAYARRASHLDAD